MKSNKQKLKSALRDLIKRYESGERKIICGLCWELAAVYVLPDSHSYEVIARYSEVSAPPGVYSGLGEQGEFTEARYNLCKKMLADVKVGRWDYLWENLD